MTSNGSGEMRRLFRDLRAQGYEVIHTKSGHPLVRKGSMSCHIPSSPGDRGYKNTLSRLQRKFGYVPSWVDKRR